jgi:hypothetical protein
MLRRRKLMLMGLAVNFNMDLTQHQYSALALARRGAKTEQLPSSRQNGAESSSTLQRVIV